MSKGAPPEPTCCPPKPDIRQRPLITPEQAADRMHVVYRIVDPCVIGLLDHGPCLTEDAVVRQVVTIRDRLRGVSHVATAGPLSPVAARPIKAPPAVPHDLQGTSSDSSPSRRTI